MDLKVSVIVPCFNYAHYLPFTLESVSSQTYQNWECLIVNDGSVDNTESVAMDFVRRDNRFILINQVNKGLSEARNTGIRNCSGELVLFLDSDDLIHEGKLKHSVGIFLEQPHCNIVYGNSYFFFDDLTNLKLNTHREDNENWMPCISGSGGTLLKELVKGNIMVVSSPVVKRSDLLKVGFFDASLKSNEDWDMWFRMAVNNCFFLYVPYEECATYIRKGHQSLMTDLKTMRRTRVGVRIKFNLLLMRYFVFNFQSGILSIWFRNLIYMLRNE